MGTLHAGNERRAEKATYGLDAPGAVLLSLAVGLSAGLSAWRLRSAAKRAISGRAVGIDVWSAADLLNHRPANT